MVSCGAWSNSGKRVEERERERYEEIYEHRIHELDNHTHTYHMLKKNPLVQSKIYSQVEIVCS